ncbi:MAG TPA: DNA-binding domain-containing protein [Candidatus Binataceae bacterium]|nr:DNA-binding domain-containing protein [Candidatus Binataceae bacterium]
MPSDLSRLENLLYRLITAPSGVAEGLANEQSLRPGGLASVIVGDDRLSAEERVDIYANMYFYRILDVLKEDFPATLATLGEERFHNLATGYLIEYPPSHFSISYAGQHLADFIRAHPIREDFPLLADLAQMERALIDVFHAADATPLDAEAMRAIPPEEWPSIRMRLHPAHQIIELEFDVAPMINAVEESGTTVPPPRDHNRMLVWRKRNTVFYRAIDELERDALNALADGSSFGEICEVIASRVAEGDDPAAAINQSLEVWLRDGLLVRESV